MDKEHKHLGLNNKIWQSIPPAMREAALLVEKRLLDNGHQAFIVGGCVRDLLLQKVIKDIDFTTSATPQEVMKIFPRTVPIGIDFGTVLVLEKKFSFEVTTFRLETDYQDGRHPTAVHFGTSLQEDVQRRDFSINGMAFSLTQKKLYDYVDGLVDLHQARIKTIGSAYERFSEDGLRPIRGCRFAAHLDFSIDEETLLAMKNTNATTSQVARERFYDEWRKTSKSKNKYRFWQLLFENGIFQIFMSDLKNLCEKFDQLTQAIEYLNQPWPKMSVYIAKFLIMEKYLLENSIWAQPVEKQAWELFNNFYRHHKFPAKVFQQALRMFASPFFNFLKILTSGQMPNEFLLTKALSQIQSREILTHFKFFCVSAKLIYGVDFNEQLLKNKIILILKNRHPIYLKQLAINGDDLLALGISGKQIGLLLRQMLERVMEDPALNQKEKLLAFILANKI